MVLFCGRIRLSGPRIVSFPVKFPVSREFVWRQVRSALRRQPTSYGVGEPHAVALESCAAAMEAAGVGGGNSKLGHVTALRCMAASMRRDAAIGKVPHAYRDHDHPTYASAVATSIKADVARAVATAVKPLHDEIKAANDKIEVAQTRLKDLNDKRITAASSQERKTLPPAIAALLQGGEIELGDELSLKRPN
jgi:hypothetical protein